MGSQLNFIHISDLHFRKGWWEEIGDVTVAFLRDLEKQIPDIDNPYIIFSGDLVQSGGTSDLYDAFESEFVSKLVKMGIPKDKLIFVPGNHDVDQELIKKEIHFHCGLRSQKLKEIDVNQLLKDNPDFTKKKFSSYIKFSEKYSEIGLKSDRINGAGFSVGDEIGVYLLNTAAFSLGGAKGPSGEELSDQGYLHIETREMSRWLNENDHQLRVLVMHHPISWFSEEMQGRMSNLIADKFDIVLHGHVHNQNVSSYHSSNSGSVILSSPPLFTRRNGDLGYSIAHIDSNKTVKLRYRSWSGKSNFVPGVKFSDNETGELVIDLFSKRIPVSTSKSGDTVNNPVGRILDGYFNDSIDSIRYGNYIWVEPDIGAAPENSSTHEKTEIISCAEFATGLKTSILRAPPQFGLSVLGTYFAKTFWENGKTKIPVVVDCNEFDSHSKAVREYISTRPEVKVCGDLPIGLIVLDNFVESNKAKVRQANEISKEFPDAILILLSRCDANAFGENSLIDKLNFDFEMKYVWSLKRPQIRRLVSQFVEGAQGLDEDETVDYLISHFDNLNIHRTAHNAITLLTILQSQVDASPVNRTEMIEKFLYIRFSRIQSIPRYSTLPDLKDSLYVIGYFVERLVNRDEFSFTKSDFIKIAIEYCEKQYLDIEVDVLFSCLIESGVLSCRSGVYYFRFAYWLHFFIAHRMHQNPEFFGKIMAGASYARYPAVIEYYSGIDRRASGLVDDLASDLSTENAAYLARSKLDQEFDPLMSLAWKPQISEMEDALRLVQDEVKESNLPKEIKDAVADRNFDRSLPYDQTMKKYIAESSLYLCMQKMKAAARALRNSDHADVDGRKRLFSEIMAAMKSEMHLLAAVAPLLSEMGYLPIEGMGYRLDSKFNLYEDKDERLIKILSTIPYNMSIRYLDDIYSPKMAPIFYEYLENTDNNQEKSLLVRFLIERKPKKWEHAVKEYINSLGRDSFYLYMVSNQIKGNYKFGFNSHEERKKLRELTGLIYSLHYTKIKKPSGKVLIEYAEKVLGKAK